MKVSAGSADADDGGRVTAPMHGNPMEVLVAPGASVVKGARLGVLEAMKMQHEITTRIEGTRRETLCQAGTLVAAGDVLFLIELANP